MVIAVGCSPRAKIDNPLYLHLQTTQEYDTFGSTAAEMARRAAAEAAAERPSGKQTVKLEEAVRMLEACSLRPACRLVLDSPVL